MTQIPISQGVQARPTVVTPTVRQPVDTGERFIAQGINQLGNAFENAGLQAMQQEQRDQQAYEASRVFEFKNQAKRFDNQERVRLSEMGASQETINSEKANILDRRKDFINDLKGNYKDNKRLLATIEREEQSSQVDLEFFLDKDLANKRRTYGENQLYESVYDLRDRFESASLEEMPLINKELGETMQVGLSSGLIDIKDIDRIEKDFKDSRKRKNDLKQDLLVKGEKLRINDPWQFLQKFDPEEAPSVNLADTGAAADSLEERINFVNKKNKQYNTDLTVLNELETQSFIKDLETANPEQSIGYLRSLTSNITDDQQNILAKEIFKENSSIGLAISIADEDPKTAADIIAGNKAIKDKVIVMPSQNVITENFLDIAGDAIQQTDFRKAAIEAVTTIYANNAFKENKNDTTYTSSIMDKSIKQILGDIIEINDSKVIGFRKNDGQFIDEGDFEDLFKGLTRDQILTTHGDLPRLANGQELELDDLKDSDLVVIGDGLYSINLFDEFAVDKEGNPFELNLKQIYNQ